MTLYIILKFTQISRRMDGQTDIGMTAKELLTKPMFYFNMELQCFCYGLLIIVQKYNTIALL